MSGSADLILGTNGVNPDKKAGIRESFTLSEQGQFVQIRILNTAGRLTLRSIGIEGARGDQTGGTVSE